MLSAQMFTPDKSESQAAESFRQRLFTIASHGQLSMAIALGFELGLFKALAKVGHPKKPASAKMVALALDGHEMKARYVHEWLSCMACGEIIESDESGQAFWIAEERIPVLVDKLELLATGPPTADTEESPTKHPSPDSAFILNRVLPCFGGEAFMRVAEVFRASGPLGIDSDNTYDICDFYPHGNAFARSLHSKHFVELLSAQKDLTKEGVAILDVGCGEGFYSLKLAKCFPNSHVTGVDISKSAIDKANANASQCHLANAKFLCCDAAQLQPEWSNCYDLAFIVYACHEQPRPDLSLREIYRCLKPAATLIMVETAGMGNCHADRERYGATLSSLQYAFSIFNCLPGASNQADSLQIGGVLGKERGKRLMVAAGFKPDRVDAEDIPFSTLNPYLTAVYKAVK